MKFSKRKINLIAFLCCAFICLAALNSANSQGNPIRCEALEKLIYKKPDVFGENKSVWLEQYTTSLQQWEKMAVIFGYADDLKACKDIVQTMEDKYYSEKFRCQTLD